MQFLEPLECHASFRKLPGLRKARTQNSMTAGKSRSVLYSLSTEINRFDVSASQVMSGGETHKEYCVLRIVRVHPDGLFQMRYRSVRLAIKRKGPAKITVSGSEVRVQIDGALKLLNRLLSVPPRECHVAEREMGPRIIVIERGRSRSQSFCLPNLRFQFRQCPRGIARN